MSTPDDLDVQHIEMVAEGALALYRPPTRIPRYVTCAEHDGGVAIHVAEDADLASVRTALRLFGYHAEDLDGDAGTERPAPYIQVTGWSPDQLSARRDSLATAIRRLLDDLERTVEHAVDNYRSLRAKGDVPETARRRARLRTKIHRHNVTAYEIGPLVSKKLTPRDPDIAAQVAVNHQLYERVDNLLYHHGRLAGDTINWVSEHADTLPAGEAKARARDLMQPQITGIREEVRQNAQGALWQAADRWLHEQADELALGFASWYSVSHDPDNPPDLGQAFQQWVDAGLPAPAVRATAAGLTTRIAADSAVRTAAADFPALEPEWQPATRPPTVTTGPSTEPPVAGRSPRRDTS